MRKVILMGGSMIMLFPSSIRAEDKSDGSYVVLEPDDALKIESNWLYFNLEDSMDYTSELRFVNDAESIWTGYNVIDKSGS